MCIMASLDRCRMALMGAVLGVGRLETGTEVGIDMDWVAWCLFLKNSRYGMGLGIIVRCIKGSRWVG